MPSYFDLSATDQGELLAAAQIQTGRSPSVLEKDIWLSCVLMALFSMPDRKAMAFKGGTSLSKVYSAIHRFSEDVDITIDYRELGCERSLAEMADMSRRQRDRIGMDLKAQVREYTHERVQPYLQARLQALGCGDECAVTLSDDGENLHVLYPSRVADRGPYLRDHVLVEFGGRNIIEPNAMHTLEPDVAALFPAVAFPRAEGVVVLALERTFWEKATLIHAECNRPINQGRERLSRHWYDLALLARHEAGQRALADLELLADVIGLKEVFYRSGTTNYDQCLAGALNLIPDAENRRMLARDYQQMQRAGMLNGHVLPIEEIFNVLAAVQAQVNERVRRRGRCEKPCSSG